MEEKAAGRTVALPTSRAFVVQFVARVDDGNPFRGRVEHLASGSAAHFDSLTRLGEFVARLLGAGAPEANPAQPRDAAATEEEP